jgi:3-oxoacyl-[acyl-carrier-protein] synthase-3
MHANWKHVRLLSWAEEVPSTEITSEALEERIAPLLARLDFARGTLAEKTGVHARRWYEPEVDPETVASRVAQAALSKAGLPARDVGLIINASIDHRFFEPSGAHLVGRYVGVGSEAQLFDVRNACLGFLDAVTIAADRIEAGVVDVAIVVAAEAGGMRRAIDASIGDALEKGELTPELWVPLTMGCGSVAWVLCSSRVAEGAASIDRCLTRNLAQHSELCVGRIEDDGRLTVRANGAGILKQGVALVATTFSEAQRYGATLEQVFMHQVGVAHVKALEKTLSFTMHPRGAVFRELGNTGPVGMPLALARAADANSLRPGPVTMLGAGSGLSASVMSLTWGAPS